jgi:NAD(P)-dependent dehydrogenase (short-subunit alcohol dehydrogenase family)
VTHLDGRTAVVAGAGPGIGRACAVALGRAGADVVIAARAGERLAGLAAEVAGQTGGSVTPVVADLARLESCRFLVEQAIERHGRIDVLVNVATAGGGWQPLDQPDWDSWRHAFEVNVIGTLELTRLAAQRMREVGGGSIIQIGTFGTHSLPPGQARYTATKQAMISASLSLAREVGKWNVRVNIVTPGYTTGPPLDNMVAGVAARTGEDVGEVSKRLAGTAALRRHVDPDDIAEAVLFLAGPGARSITGVEVPVTAGQR